jgi:asparagine synthase (glutamine-hydrolysing)
MCGIFAILNKQNSDLDNNQIQGAFMHGVHRGPDHTAYEEYNYGCVGFGFHRLAINGLDTISNQPISINGIHLICNGEVYNYPELYASLNIAPTTNSDCEIILHLYRAFGIEHTLHMLNASEFAFVLYDSIQNVVYAARDPNGVRPLFKGVRHDTICFASEMKMIPEGMTITPVLPGTYTNGRQVYTYYTLPSMNPALIRPHTLIKDTLYECVRRRVVHTERPIACLLSGGLDSSLIASLVTQCLRDTGQTRTLETYSIGLEGAEDLKYASMVAEYLGSKHTSIVLTEEEFLSAIPEVIFATETYDTTSIRASVGNFLVAEYIKKHSDAKVIFNGDGADEVCGGYLYLKNAPNEVEFDKECRRLVKDIHYFDALRSDRCISYHGLEARTPFLDRAFVELYMSIPAKLRYTQCEKALLRSSFEGMLPREILWRKKEAFSDGVSSLNNSWYSIIQRSIPPTIQCEYARSGTSMTPEQYYYKKIYDSYYVANILPYYWMPKYTSSKDCSARTLETYAT